MCIRDRVARKEVVAFEKGSDATSSFGSGSAAHSWFRRVENWESILLRDLESDSVPAPGVLGENFGRSNNVFENWRDRLQVVQQMPPRVVGGHNCHFKETTHPDACNGKSQRNVAGPRPS